MFCPRSEGLSYAMRLFFDFFPAEHRAGPDCGRAGGDEGQGGAVGGQSRHCKA